MIKSQKMEIKRVSAVLKIVTANLYQKVFYYQTNKTFSDRNSRIMTNSKHHKFKISFILNIKKEIINKWMRMKLMRVYFFLILIYFEFI